jgi:lysyl-tRNA synthetase class 2
MVPVLAARSVIHRAIHQSLDAAGVWHLDASLLAAGAPPDPGLDSFEVPGAGYLVTSTEYAIKRALAAGVPAAWTWGANFRRGEQSPTHNPEFTMLEWGVAGASITDIQRQTEGLVGAAADALAAAGHLDPWWTAARRAGPWEAVGVRDAIARAAGIDPELPWGILAARAAAALGLQVPDGAQTPDDAAFDALTWVVDALQPRLGAEAPVWLVDWPAGLCTSTPGDRWENAPRVELFARGLELADGFPFHTDRAEALSGMRAALADRARLGMPSVTLDAGYLRALDTLPPGAGIAVGVDRLVMALTGASRIQDVLLTPWTER